MFTKLLLLLIIVFYMLVIAGCATYFGKPGIQCPDGITYSFVEGQKEPKISCTKKQK